MKRTRTRTHEVRGEGQEGERWQDFIQMDPKQELAKFFMYLLFGGLKFLGCGKGEPIIYLRKLWRKLSSHCTPYAWCRMPLALGHCGDCSWVLMSSCSTGDSFDSQSQERWIVRAFKFHHHRGVFNRAKFLIAEECDKVCFTWLSHSSNILRDWALKVPTVECGMISLMNNFSLDQYMRCRAETLKWCEQNCLITTGFIFKVWKGYEILFKV